MGRKKNLTPIETPALREGCAIHWDTYRVENKRIQFLVTCSSCHQDRWVGRQGIKAKTFTGLCRSCTSKQNPGPKPFPGYKKRFKDKKARVYVKTLTQEGYITLSVSGLSEADQQIALPMSQKNGASPRVLEHRLVVALSLGRPLKRYEVVHHKNGDKTDNRLENLELRHSKDCKGARVSDLQAEIKRLKAILDQHHISF